MSQNPQLGIALLLNFFLGLLGADKFYVGRTDLGILQIILTITFIGLIINIPWTMLCGLSLFIAIFLGGAVFMYPGVQWAPISNRDKIIAVCLIVFMFVASFLRKSTSIQRYNNACPVCHKSPCICSKEKYSGCSSCSRRMLPPH